VCGADDGTDRPVLAAALASPHTWPSSRRTELCEPKASGQELAVSSVICAAPPRSLHVGYPPETVVQTACFTGIPFLEKRSLQKPSPPRSATPRQSCSWAGDSPAVNQLPLNPRRPSLSEPAHLLQRSHSRVAGNCNQRAMRQPLDRLFGDSPAISHKKIRGKSSRLYARARAIRTPAQHASAVHPRPHPTVRLSVYLPQRRATILICGCRFTTHHHAEKALDPA